jgi:hypothetical protein
MKKFNGNTTANSRMKYIIHYIKYYYQKKLLYFDVTLISYRHYP